MDTGNSRTNRGRVSEPGRRANCPNSQQWAIGRMRSHEFILERGNLYHDIFVALIGGIEVVRVGSSYETRLEMMTDQY
jgi:hypothetical protein